MAQEEFLDDPMPDVIEQEWLTKPKSVAEIDLARGLTDLEAQGEKGSFFYSINRTICVCVK